MTVGNDADHGLAYREVKVRTGLRYFRHQGRVCRPTRLRTGFWADVPIFRAENLSGTRSITLLLCNQGSRSADRLLHGSVPIPISHSPILLFEAKLTSRFFFWVHRYWGQNSRGTSYPNETANYQKPISFYCRVSWFPRMFRVLSTPSEGTETRLSLSPYSLHPRAPTSNYVGHRSHSIGLFLTVKPHRTMPSTSFRLRS